MKLVFDFGGVLFQWQPAELLKRVLPERAHDDHSAAHWVGEVFQSYGGDWGDFDKGLLSADEVVERLVRRTGLGQAEAQAIVDAVPGLLLPIEPTVALLERLRASGVPLYYLSNMPAPYADHLERTHPFVGWFAAGIFSGRVQQSKPDPAIFALAAERFGAAPEELVFLDDHPPNIDAARAAGWRALHFTDAERAERELRELGWSGAE
ncbi:HAD family phosphatase [Aquincola sp. S2]|uniref:HAD family phosphatase n=1 Tax=Pseudaquabacterium terrae TaxID=2732868 RepID=A0ABX2EBU5_9BURK|nr:HAD family phosphatase [Aquabacterium terrae]NRF66624.1 HAD family phosphatase [Aquabacterium terrae]